MTTTRVLKVGVIGCGGIAQMMHLPFLRSMPGKFHISAISDLSPGLLKAIGSLYNVGPERQFTAYQDLVKQDLDVVLVLSGGTHAPQVLAAVRAGKHVLVEKPLCFTLREADLIAEAVARAGVKVMVAYMKRYDPGYRKAQQLLEGMQDIRYAQINTLHPAEDDYLSIHGILRFDDIPGEVLARLSREQEQLYDEAIGAVRPSSLRNVYGNILLGSMVHDMNALRGLLGEPDEVLSTEIWPTNEREPSITSVLRYGERTRVVFTWTFLEKLRDYFEEIALMSSSNRLRIQFPSPYLRHFPTPIVFQGMDEGVAYEKRILASYEEAFCQELLAFHHCVVNDVTPLTTVADARNDILWLQRIFAKFQPDGLSGEAVQES
ncbi:MAG: Gfo/Idh/MocA family oxidoreductase [Anaerolineae bacterium]